MKKKITIAIDGFAACGKSTLAKDLAKALGYTFIDSGAMYRAVALYCLENNLIDEQGNIDLGPLESNIGSLSIEISSDQKVYLNRQDITEVIRSPRVAAIVSKVAAIKLVRQKLVEQQQYLGKDGGIVMDGRDIGSVVFPAAELKLFVTASDAVRTQRRLAELNAKGEQQTKEEVLQNLKSRDLQDSTRAESPLVQVADAIVLDTSDLNREQQLEWALLEVQKIIEKI
ncbi:MAG: (d)CMP kinase [Flavobacteriales bacterium]